jgi:hypothetical protein
MGRESAYVAMSRHRMGVELHVAKDAFSADDWTKLHAKPENAISTHGKQQALDALTKAYEEKLARDMAKASEKDMSTEHGIAKEAVLEKAMTPQKIEQGQAQVAAKSQERSRGRGMGLSL